MAKPKDLEPWQVEDAQRLSRLFKEKSPKSQADFGADLGIGTQGMVWQYLNARRPLNVDAAVRFAKGLSVKIDDFSPTIASQIREAASFADSFALQKIEQPVIAASESAANDPEYVALPLKRVKIRAGVAGFSLDQTGDGTAGAVYVFRGWLAKRGINPEVAFASRVGGMSMWPRVQEGDVVVVNPGDTERRNGIVYAFNHDGEFTLKRLKRQHGNRWYLTSDNPDKTQFPPVHADEGTFMIGRAVLLQAEEI